MTGPACSWNAAVVRRVVVTVLGLAWVSAAAAGCSETREYYKQGHRYGYYDSNVAAEKQVEAVQNWLPQKGWSF
jgi:hypothetical protein